MRPEPVNSFRREMLAVAALLVVAKLAVWLFDPVMRTFMGDSASYLWSAYSNEPAPDRSFSFSLLIRATALEWGDLRVLGWMHGAAGVLVSLLMFTSLRRHFALRYEVAAVLAFLLALEPGQLFYERMVMAETFGTLALVAMVFAGLRHARYGGWMNLAAMALCGTLVVSLRLSSVPVVLGFALLPVLCRRWDPASRSEWLHPAMNAVLALAMTVGLHQAYKVWFDDVSNFQDRRDYSHSTGKMRLGLLAPLVKEEHLVRAGLPANLLDSVSPDPHDPLTRESQMWGPTGLYERIREHASDPESASRKIAMYAFRDDPFGLLRLGVTNIAGYFDLAIATHRMNDDLGTRSLDDHMLKIVREQFGWDARNVATTPSPVFRYFGHSRWWWVAVLFGLPLVSLWLLWHARRSAAATTLALLGLGLFASHVLFSHIVSFRYLHPFTPFLFWTVGALLACHHSGADPAAPDRPASSSRGGRA